MLLDHLWISWPELREAEAGLFLTENRREASISPYYQLFKLSRKHGFLASGSRQSLASLAHKIWIRGEKNIRRNISFIIQTTMQLRLLRVLLARGQWAFTPDKQVRVTCSWLACSPMVGWTSSSPLFPFKMFSRWGKSMRERRVEESKVDQERGESSRYTVQYSTYVPHCRLGIRSSDTIIWCRQKCTTAGRESRKMCFHSTTY